MYPRQEEWPVKGHLATALCRGPPNPLGVPLGILLTSSLISHYKCPKLEISRWPYPIWIAILSSFVPLVTCPPFWDTPPPRDFSRWPLNQTGPSFLSRPICLPCTEGASRAMKKKPGTTTCRDHGKDTRLLHTLYRAPLDSGWARPVSWPRCRTGWGPLRETRRSSAYLLQLSQSGKKVKEKALSLPLWAAEGQDKTSFLFYFIYFISHNKRSKNDGEKSDLWPFFILLTFLPKAPYACPPGAVLSISVPHFYKMVSFIFSIFGNLLLSVPLGFSIVANLSIWFVRLQFTFIFNIALISPHE